MCVDRSRENIKFNLVGDLERVVVIGWLGRYDSGASAHGGELNLLPEWWDLLVVIVFSLVIYFWAVRQAAPSEQIAEFVADDEAKLAVFPGEELQDA